jgi:tellurite resistance protein
MTIDMPATQFAAPFSAQDALVAVMVAVSAADENITTPSCCRSVRIVETLPVFEGYDRERVRSVSQTVLDLFTEEDGLDALFGLVGSALPAPLNETAYALACDVAAADGHAFQAELQFLLELRHALDIDRLHGRRDRARLAARHRRLPSEG